MNIEHTNYNIPVSDEVVSKVLPFKYKEGNKVYLGLMYEEIQKVIEKLTLTAGDAQASDYFGVSVALDGTRLVVGARSEDTVGSDAGKVYIYDFNGTSYDEIGTLTASDAQASDQFGVSVALDGARLVVGAHTEDTATTGAGKVYIYDFNGTSYDEIGTLTASDAQAYDYFGVSVALDGNRLVVGAYIEDTAGSEAGKVYIYDFNGTSYDEIGTLTASDAQANDYFGISVALDGTRLVVGAYAEDTAGADAGKVYIYDFNGTSYDEIGTLTASDVQAYDYFGVSVALDGTRLAVGAYAEDTAGSNAGKVYIYDFNGTSYDEIGTLTANDAQAGDNFGASVALDGARLVVGAYSEDTAGSEAGKVYIYDLNNFDENLLNYSIDSTSYINTNKKSSTKMIVLNKEI